MPSRRRSALAICQRQTTGESFKIPTRGCGKARRFCFARQAQSLRLTDDLKGMANRSVEIPRLPTTEADGFRGRVEGSKRRQMTARSDEAPLQLFGVPVSGGEQMRGAREVKQQNAKAGKLTDHLAVHPVECAGGCAIRNESAKVATLKPKVPFGLKGACACVLLPSGFVSRIPLSRRPRSTQCALAAFLTIMAQRSRCI